MRLLGLRTCVDFSVFARRDRSGSAFGARYLGLMGFLAALVMASEASAGALCPSPNFPAASFFATGDRPVSVVVADLDGDSFPDLVTANGNSDDVTVFLPEPDMRLLTLAGVALLALLTRWRSWCRAR